MVYFVNFMYFKQAVFVVKTYLKLSSILETLPNAEQIFLINHSNKPTNNQIEKNS